MRLAIVTTLWHRAALADVMLRHTRKVAPDAFRIAVGSEGIDSERLAGNAGWHYIEAPNDPRPAKWHQGFAFARGYGCDAVMILGSDDLISPDYLATVHRELDAGADFVGLLDCYVYAPATDKALHWQGYEPTHVRHGEPVGSGRTYAKPLLDLLDWKPWGTTDARTGLDLPAWHAIQAHAKKQSIGTMAQRGALIDVKHDPENVGIGSFRSMLTGSVQIAPETALAAIPDTRDILRALPQNGPDKRAQRRP